MEVSEHLKIQPTTRSFAALLTRLTMVCDLRSDSCRFNVQIHHNTPFQYFTMHFAAFRMFCEVKYLCGCESVPAWCLSCVFSLGSCSPFSCASLPSLTESTGPARSGGTSRLGPRGEWQRVAHTQRRGRPTMGLWREEAWPCLLPLMSRGAREEILGFTTNKKKFRVRTPGRPSEE